MTRKFKTIQDYLYDLSFGFCVINIWLVSKNIWRSLANSCKRHVVKASMTAFCTSSDTAFSHCVSSTLEESENPFIAAAKMGSFSERVSRKAFSLISLSY